MKNISQIKINQLMDNLYLDSAINRLYEEASEFEWISDISSEAPSLEFNGMELWVDVNHLTNDEKVEVGRYVERNTPGIDPDYDGVGRLYNLMNHPKNYKGIVVHCGLEDNGFEPHIGKICTMNNITYENDPNTENSIYIDGSQFLNRKPITEGLIIEGNIIKDIVTDLGLSKKFIFTFGTGIGAFMEPVKKLLAGSGVHLSEVELSLLVITAIAMMLGESNTKEAINKLKEEGLFKYLKDVVGFITNTKNLINKITMNVANASYGLADILGFTFLLIPAMKIITGLIEDYGISSESLGQLFTGLSAASLTYGVKSVINKIRNRL
jgi:hypothetical protein